jgi:hypothetical protein
LAFFVVGFSLGCGVAGGLGGGDAKAAALNMASSSAQSSFFSKGEEGEEISKHGKMMEGALMPKPLLLPATCPVWPSIEVFILLRHAAGG